DDTHGKTRHAADIVTRGTDIARGVAGGNLSTCTDISHYTTDTDITGPRSSHAARGRTGFERGITIHESCHAARGVDGVGVDLCLGGGAVEQGHPGPRPGQGPGHVRAEHPARPGDHGYLAGKIDVQRVFLHLGVLLAANGLKNPARVTGASGRDTGCGPGPAISTAGRTSARSSCRRRR